MVTADELRTLPMIAREAGLSLDALRRFVRKRGDLAALGRSFGANRFFDAAAVKKVVGEFRKAHPPK